MKPADAAAGPTGGDVVFTLDNMLRKTMQRELFEPVWSLLESASLSGLMARKGRLPPAVRLIDNQGVDALDAPLVGVAGAILSHARERDGLRLTPSGFLALADVAAIFDALPWDEAGKDLTRSLCRVIHEQDFAPLHLARLVLRKAGLLRRRGEKLYCPREAPDLARCFPRIVESTFWRTELGALDGVPLSNWPQDHIGVTLWALSACGLQWSEPERLMRLVTFSHPALEQAHGDGMVSAFQLRVIRPLVWLGLMEMERPWDFSARSLKRVRKSPRFDETLAFTVRLRDRATGIVH